MYCMSFCITQPEFICRNDFPISLWSLNLHLLCVFVFQPVPDKGEFCSGDWRTEAPWRGRWRVSPYCCAVKEKTKKKIIINFELHVCTFLRLTMTSDLNKQLINNKINKWKPRGGHRQQAHIHVCITSGRFIIIIIVIIHEHFGQWCRPAGSRPSWPHRGWTYTSRSSNHHTWFGGAVWNV